MTTRSPNPFLDTVGTQDPDVSEQATERNELTDTNKKDGSSERARARESSPFSGQQGGGQPTLDPQSLAHRCKKYFKEPRSITFIRFTRSSLFIRFIGFPLYHLVDYSDRSLRLMLVAHTRRIANL